MARVFLLTMSKFRGKRAKNLNKLSDQGLFYAIVTGLSGMVTSLLIKNIKSNVIKMQYDG